LYPAVALRPILRAVWRGRNVLKIRARSPDALIAMVDIGAGTGYLVP
jgi:hypothetical protein